jgi:signal transduction histidine kinase
MSFRTRLLLTSSMTLLVGLGALIVAGNVLLDRRVGTETSGLLRVRSEAQVAGLTVRPGGVRVRETANDDVIDKRAWVFSGQRVLEQPPGVSPELEAAAVALAKTRRPVEVNGPSDFRLRAQPVVDSSGAQVATVVVAESTEALEDLQQEVLAGSIVIALLVLGAGGLGIRSAVGGALRPVVDMTAAAREWGAHDLERRFALGPARDELTGLAATLDGLLGRIAASRRHEQRYATELAHELRTPLAGIRGRAELALGAGEHDHADREAALRAIIEQADRLSATIDTLMAAARQEFGETGATVDLEAIARELDDVELEVRGPIPRAEGAAEVARRALAPLVDNARRHARSRIVVKVSSGERFVSVGVSDDGPGLPEGMDEDVFSPGFQGHDGGDGAGLGLPLARRLARSCGGDVSVGAGPGGCFVLSLPRADP